MHIIYYLVFLLVYFVERAWEADHKQYNGRRDLTQIPPLDPPFLLNLPFSQLPVPTPFSLRAMPPRRTVPKPLSEAAPVAVGQHNVNASRRPRTKPVGSSRTRSKVTSLGPLRALGSETYQLT